MKKFFGLKMALAVLAAGAFVSCSDSEAGDIYIPTPSGGSTTVEVKYPAPTYVVAGVVTDAKDGSALEGVAVTGAVTATTDATGFFTSGTKSEPINGVITFTKDGYTTVNRAVAMAAVTTGSVSESLVVSMSTGTASLPDGITVVAADPTAAPAPLPELEVVVPANALAALGVPTTNDSDEPMDVMIPADSFGLPYGATVAPEKNDADALNTLILWCMNMYQNDPTVDYRSFIGKLYMTIAANATVTEVEITPLLKVLKFIYEAPDGIYEYLLDVIEQYSVNPSYNIPDPHNPHDGHDDANGGGGETSGV